MNLSFAIAGTTLTLILLSSWRAWSTQIGRSFLAFIVSADLWVVTRLISEQLPLGGGGANRVSLAFALIACASVARLVSQALSESERLPLSVEAMIWIPTFGVWLVDDPLMTLLWASLAFASSGIRMASLPMRSWDGFRGALYGITASMTLLGLLPIASIAGLPSGVMSAAMPLAVVGVGLSLVYGLPRLGLLSSDRVQHSRVIQAMSDGVLIVDMNGGLVDFNQAAAEILELDEASHGIRPLAEALSGHPDLFELLSGAVDGRSLYSLESMRRKGEDRTFDIQLSALFDSAGSIQSRVVVLRDISDRISIERENRRQARHARLVHEVSATVHEADTIDAGLEAALALVAQTMDLPLGQFLRSSGGGEDEAEEEDGHLQASGIVYCGPELEEILASTAAPAARTSPPGSLQLPVGSFTSADMRVADPRGVLWWKELGFEPALSVPILIGARVYGMFEFFSADPVDVEDATTDMLEMVRNAIEQTGVDPEQVELELTESTIMQDDKLTVHTLRALREMGIGLSLDDFGTGYSSLSYLRRFTIDRVKVDRSFVAELTENCDELQGYLFGRPCPADEFVERLRARPMLIDESLKDEVEDG